MVICTDTNYNRDAYELQVISGQDMLAKILYLFGHLLVYNVPENNLSVLHLLNRLPAKHVPEGQMPEVRFK